MSLTIDQMNEELSRMHLTAEERARALQAAYVGESPGKAALAVGRALSGLYGRWQNWVETRRNIAHLQAMDERLLADIGLSHATLEETLRRPAHKPEDAHAVATVEAVVTEAAPAQAPANQDRPAERVAA